MNNVEQEDLKQTTEKALKQNVYIFNLDRKIQNAKDHLSTLTRKVSRQRREQIIRNLEVLLERELDDLELTMSRRRLLQSNVS